MGRIECGSSLESLEGEIEEAVRSFVFLLELVLFFFFLFGLSERIKFVEGKKLIWRNCFHLFLVYNNFIIYK